MKRILLSLMTIFMFACQTETVSIRFFFQDGSGFSAVVTVDAGTVLTPTDPKRDGFVFQGWFTRPAGGEKVDFSLPMTQNRDFYAQWKQNTCFVIFHSSFEGDNRVFRQEFPEHGEERLIPNPFVREGYRFLGWSDSPGSVDIRWADRAVFTMETSDVDLYAVWTEAAPDKCSIVFHASLPENDITVIQSAPLNSVVILVANPFVRDGYRFLGWSQQPEAETAEFPDKSEWTVTGNVDLYAVWAETVTVTFLVGSKSRSVEILKGEKAPKPPTEPKPEQEGQVFYAWMNDGERWNFETPVESPLTLTAGWVISRVLYRASEEISLESSWENYDAVRSFFDAASGEGMWVFDQPLTKVPQRAFFNNTRLISASFPESVVELGEYAFYGCTSLTEIEIPGQITKIPSYAFYNCKNLKSIEIPDSVTGFDNGAFSLCLALETINIPDGVLTSGKESFLACTSLTSVTIPSLMSILDMSLFFACTSLETVVLSEGVTTINDIAFGFCAALQTIDLPSTISAVNGAVFSDCTRLKSVAVKSVNPPSGVTDLTFPETIEEILVPSDSVNAYKAAEGWSGYTDKIKAMP